MPAQIAPGPFGGGPLGGPPPAPSGGLGAGCPCGGNGYPLPSSISPSVQLPSSGSTPCYICKCTSACSSMEVGGAVVDAVTGLPLPDATVVLGGPVGGSQTTNSDGGFLFSGLPAGTYTVGASKANYKGASSGPIPLPRPDVNPPGVVCWANPGLALEPV